MADDRTPGIVELLERQAAPGTVVRVAEPPDADGAVERRRSYDCLRGVRDRANSVEFELLPAGGAWPAAEYAFLQESWWTPGDRQQRIVLAFTTGLKVTITGWGLRPLYERLRQHRVTAVREDGRDPVAERQAALDGAESWVWSIQIERPEEER